MNVARPVVARYRSGAAPLQPTRSRTLETWLVTVILLLTAVFVKFFTPSADSSEADVASSSPLAQLLWGMIYIGAVAGIFFNGARAWVLTRRSIPLLLLVAITVASAVWSVDPMVSLKRGIGLIGTTAFAYYVVSRFRLQEFLGILAITTGLAAVTSALLIVAFPSIGKMQDSYVGAWIGVFQEKNGLGQFMALGVLTFMVTAVEAPAKKRWVFLAPLALCFVLLVGSQSVTALIGCVLPAAITGMVYVYRSRRFAHIGVLVTLYAIAALIVVIVALGLGLSDLFALVGRDASLTGRTDFWPSLYQAIHDRLFLGFGYNAFWEPNGEYRFYVAPTLGWRPAHAHEGYLDLLLDVGIVGTFFFVIAICSAIWCSVSYFLRNCRASASWPMMIVVTFILVNLTESRIVAYNNTTWIIFVIAFLYALVPNDDDPVARRLRRPLRRFISRPSGLGPRAASSGRAPS